MIKIVISILFTIGCVLGQTIKDSNKLSFPLDSVNGLELINVKADMVNHKGKKGIQISKSNEEVKGETLVVLSEITFKDGTISLELTGEPAPDADPQMRGFVGVAFRVNPLDYSNYECIYLRPANGRAENQLQRNHSVQYISHPEFPWYKLRSQSPGLYESYVDIALGEWTKIKIEVKGKTAKLYVHDADQPCLIVNDLKLEESEGKVALWLHSSTLARYRNLVIIEK